MIGHPELHRWRDAQGFMDAAEIADPPAPPLFGTTHERVGAASAWALGENELNVLQRGDHLEITARVDREGRENLKELLGHYEKILKLLQPGNSKSKRENEGAG